jgi:hypothetical protein
VLAQLWGVVYAVPVIQLFTNDCKRYKDCGTPQDSAVLFYLRGCKTSAPFFYG